MSCNPNNTMLDSGQIIKKVFDCEHDAYRIVWANNVELAIALDAADGDSVTAYTAGFQTSGAFGTGSATSVAAIDCRGYRTFQMYSDTTSDISDSKACTLEISPADSGDVWFQTSLSITPGASSGAKVLSTTTTVAARRLRVVATSALPSGAATIYVVGE